MATTKLATLSLRVWFEHAATRDELEADDDERIIAVAIGHTAPMPFASLDDETRAAVLMAVAFRDRANDLHTAPPRLGTTSTDDEHEPAPDDPVLREIDRALGGD